MSEGAPIGRSASGLSTSNAPSPGGISPRSLVQLLSSPRCPAPGGSQGILSNALVAELKSRVCDSGPEWWQRAVCAIRLTSPQPGLRGCRQLHDATGLPDAAAQ